MFACLSLPPPVNRGAQDVLQLARDFSPRVETHGSGLVTLDISGLGSLLGDARAIGQELRRVAADRGLRVHVAIAATTTAAILMAQSRAGLVVIPAGEEAQALAPLPLSALANLGAKARESVGAKAQESVGAKERESAGAKARESVGAKERESAGAKANSHAPAPSHAPSLPHSHAPDIAQLQRWGLRTLGDLAALPSADLSERLGQHGLLWQRWARGVDHAARPLVPLGIEDVFEEALDLEWPIEGLEPLSFVLARLFDPLCERLEQRDRGAVALHVTLTLVDKQQHERSLQLPAPMRDARVLRTLALLDLESHPPAAAIDRVHVGVEVTDGRILQFGLFARAPHGAAGHADGAARGVDGRRSRGRSGAGGLASPRRLRHGEIRPVGGQQRAETSRPRESTLERSIFSERGQIVGVGPHEYFRRFPASPE